MLDVAISYGRYKFIGYEFLTWLWFVMEKQPQVLRQVDNELVSLDIGNRIVLENTRNEEVQSITIKGDPTGLQGEPTYLFVFRDSAHPEAAVEFLRFMIISEASFWVNGTTLKETSFIISTKIPPSPNIRTGPNWASLLMPTITSKPGRAIF